MDGKDFNKLTTEYTEKYFKDLETFKGHLEDLEKSLMDESGYEPMPQWQKLALMSADMVIPITDQDKIMSLAVLGVNASELTLGVSYLEGVHVSVDFKKALFWLTRASKKNLPMAHFCIGVIYYEGLGVGYDFNISIKAFKKSIEFGIGDEPGYSGWNGIIAETFIGEMYFLGGNGISQDKKQALSWLAPAAQLNDMEAQYCLGSMYSSESFSKGITTWNKDYEKGVYWFTKAAEQGHISAQVNLASIYALIVKDYKQALNWNLKAAEQGNKEAQYAVGKIYFEGSGVPKDYKIALNWFTKSAEQGEIDSQYAIASMYVYGTGVDKSLKNAAHWINIVRNNTDKKYHKDYPTKHSAAKLWNENNLWKY